MPGGMAGAGTSDRAPIAVTQRGEADVKAAMRAQGPRDRSNHSGAASQATEAWVGPACGNVTRSIFAEEPVGL